jgi:hypothetical protein
MKMNQNIVINQKVISELKAMKEVGLRVPKKVFAFAEFEDMTQYNNMSISEIADLMVELA